MKRYNIRQILTILISSLTMSARADMGNGYGIIIDTNEHTQSATWAISEPGIGLWIEKGSWQYSNKTPACLIVLGEELENDKLKNFINELDASTVRDKKLTLQSFNDTWTFVDNEPQNSSFGDTQYEVKTKNNMTFGQLLQYVGGNDKSRVTIFFNQGCTDLNPRAFLPKEQSKMSSSGSGLHI